MVFLDVKLQHFGSERDKQYTRNYSSPGIVGKITKSVCTGDQTLPTGRARVGKRSGTRDYNIAWFGGTESVFLLTVLQLARSKLKSGLEIPVLGIPDCHSLLLLH